MSPIDQKTRPLKRAIKYRGCCIDRLSWHRLPECGTFLQVWLHINQLAAADDGERTWIAIPRLSDSSLSIRTTTPTNVVFNGLSGWKSVVTWTLIPST